MTEIVKTSILIAFLCLITSVVATAAPHSAAPMIGEKKAPQQKQALPLIPNEQQTLRRFKQAYLRQGQPKIAVFWNKAFDDQLSQWQQNSRSSQIHEFDNATVTNINPLPLDGIPPPVTNTSPDGRTYSGSYSESRIQQEKRDGLGESDGFAFSAGFTQAMLRVPAKLLDRNAIMRLTQRDLQDASKTQLISDRQEVETDALIGYADYLAEILVTPDEESDLEWAFLVTVKLVEDGQVVAMFRSSPQAPESIEKPKSHWVTTSRGYTKVTDPLPERALLSPAQAGKKVAFETMHALSGLW